MSALTQGGQVRPGQQVIRQGVASIARPGQQVRQGGDKDIGNFAPSSLLKGEVLHDLKTRHYIESLTLKPPCRCVLPGDRLV